MKYYIEYLGPTAFSVEADSEDEAIEKVEQQILDDAEYYIEEIRRKKNEVS